MRVKAPDIDDWKKLIRMLRYLKGTVDLRITLSASNATTTGLSLKWHIDAAFAVHLDYKSHSGGNLTLGKGSINTISTKQKLNTKSSTESELVAVDDLSMHVLWTRHFVMAQGYKVEENTVYQDNKSAILLEKNGIRSMGKRSRHINIRYFFIKDRYDKKELTIEYCPTDEMIGDFLQSRYKEGSSKQ